MNHDTSTPSGPSFFSKLLPTVFALAAPIAFAASCTGGDAAPEPLETVEEAATTCQCGKETITCPPDNECGYWTCSTDLVCKTCEFQAKKKEGDKCQSPANKAGVCVKDDKNRALLCCDGCVDKNGACQGGGSVGACGVAGGACDACKSDACSTGYCKEGKCGSEPVAKGTACNDGNACTTASACNGDGKCEGTSNLNCSDNNPCTVESCDPSTGCVAPVAVPNSPAKSCNDGNLCTGANDGDVCVNGTCKGAPVVCPQLDPCMNYTCDPSLGCVGTPKNEGDPCDDGSSCSDNDRCQDLDNDPSTPLTCQGDGLTCNNGNLCISPACNDETQTCPASPVYLDGVACDAFKCKLGETCLGGACQGGEQNPCDDLNPCTIDTCNEADGCVNVPIPAGTTVLCDDANPCTTGDRCDGDTCKGTEIECLPLDSCHKPGTCNEGDGMCSDPRLADGTPCDVTGECQSGVCVGGSVVTPGEGGSNGEGGSPEPGTGGATSTNGGETGEGATSSGGSAGSSNDPKKQGGVYARDPGGCSCSVPGASNERRAGGVLGLIFVAGAALLRRRRAA